MDKGGQGWVLGFHLVATRLLGSKQVQNNKNNPEKGSAAYGILLNHALVGRAFAWVSP